MNNAKEELINYLLELKIPTDIPLEEEANIVSDIFYKCKEITPRNLFRYRECNENNFRTLDEDKFLLTKPTLFNDPYDSLVYINKNKIIEDISDDGSNGFDKVKKMKEDEEFKNQEIEKFGLDFVNRLLEIGPFKSEEDRLRCLKASKEYYGLFIDKLITLSIESLKQSSYVGCLSETVESILMWSHYANNHTGFALCYDFEARYVVDVGLKQVGSEFLDKKLFPIQYSNKRFDATEFVSNNFIYNFYHQIGVECKIPFPDKLLYYKILLFKSKDWEYEKEWRIIKQSNLDYDDNKPDIDFIEIIRPKAIYLGTKINNDNKQHLLNIAKRKNITVYQMKLEPFEEEYKLTIHLEYTPKINI